MSKCSRCGSDDGHIHCTTTDERFCLRCYVGPDAKFGNLIRAAQAVIANYRAAENEKYDELAWEAFEGIQPLVDALTELGITTEKTPSPTSL